MQYDAILFKKGRYRDALRLLQESASKLPDEPEVQHRFGTVRYMGMLLSRDGKAGYADNWSIEPKRVGGLNRLRDAGLIIDVGMCDGADTAFYLAKGFRVVAVEANPVLVKRATQQFAQELKDGSLKIVDKAIGPKNGCIQFYVHRRKEAESTLQAGKWSADEADTIDVDCMTLASVLREYGVPYYLKIDIAGSADQAIASLDNISDLPIYVSADVQTPALIDRLYDLGYRAFKLVDQAPTARSALPWIPKEGRYVDMTFGWYHSGPFGEETPGRWKTRDEVLRDYHIAIAAEVPSWYDVHAKMPTEKDVPRHGARQLASLRWLPLIIVRHLTRVAQAVLIRSLAGLLRRILSAKRYDGLKAALGRRPLP